MLLMAPLALVTAFLALDGGHEGQALSFGDASRRAGAGPTAPDTEFARFRRCGDGPRRDCVIDGDTFWYGGEKIRIADINAPETGEARCATEAALGEQASRRLLDLLNQGAFTLETSAGGPDRDKYGRLLREVTRNGGSLGTVMVNDGMAEPWQGRRGDWC